MNVEAYLERIKKHIPEIDVQFAFEQTSKGAILIDIREKDEIKQGSPEAALRIPKGLLEMQIMNETSNSEQHIFLLCASGRRSLVAASNLKAMGYENVFSVKGGFKEWKNQVLPVTVPKMLDEDKAERYKRHLLIPELGEKGQLKLLESKALIVGAGGIGSPVALYLAAAGVGTIGIIDNDVVDRTNLQRQILHTEATVNTPKVESAKKTLQQLNSDITINTYNERLTKDNVEEIMSGYDIVLDGTDNFNTRYLINDACVKLKIPNVHGSVFRFEGQVAVFWPAYEAEETPCYRCLYPTPPPAEFAPSCAEAGVLGVLPGVVGVLCATEAIKILAEFGKPMLKKLLVYNALDSEFFTYDIEKRPDCTYCNCDDVSHYPDYQNIDSLCAV